MSARDEIHGEIPMTVGAEGRTALRHNAGGTRRKPHASSSVTAVRRTLRITFFGTYDERRHPRVRVLREGLDDLGFDTTIINIPLGLDTADRVRLVSEPWRAPAIAIRLAVTWIRLLARSRQARRPDVVIVGYLGHLDVHVARARWPRAHIVVDHLVSLADTLQDRGLNRWPPLVRVLRAVDRAAIAQADTVLIDTAEQLEQLPLRHRAKAVTVPVGAPHRWFGVGRGAPPPSAGLRVVFFGLYTPLQGTPTIGEAIGKLADQQISWTMVGAGQDRPTAEQLTGDAHVTWIDWVDFDDLPTLVADHDVCLGIFGRSPKALRVVPNKVFQGAAAGCAILTSDTPAQRRALGDAAVYVAPEDPAELTQVLERLASDRAEVDDLRRAARARAARAFMPAVVVSGLAAHLARRCEDPVADAPRAAPPLAPRAALRWQLVRERLAELAPEAVLEMGVGEGSVGARLARSRTYVGVEPDATSRATAAKRLPAGTRLLADVDELHDHDVFDLLCAFEVLEHIRDDRNALDRWVRHVRPGGHVLVSVPAEPDRWGPHDQLVGHMRRYTGADLDALFESVGLDVVAVEHYGFPFAYPLETARNIIAKRRLARRAAPGDAASRTASSGRHLQPPPWAGGLIWWATAPFRVVQRRFPDRGPGLVGLARRPA
jgi:glycosyltransferase involved in cell wall biosynthesis